MARSFFVLACLVCVSALTLNDQQEKPKHKAQKALSVKEKDSSEVLLSNGRIMNVAMEYQSGRTLQQRAALPKFVFKGGPAKSDTDGFSWGQYRWNLDNPGLRNHPARSKEDAQFVITCCLDESTKNHFLKLPKRSPEKPYLIKALDIGKVKDVFAKRQDFYALNYDLRDGLPKEAEPVRGVTIAPHNYFSGKKVSIDAPRKFFATFQGRKTSKLRREMHDAFAKSKYKQWKNVSVETIMDRNWNVMQQTGDHHFNEKMSTTYALLPRGDDRWSLRFSEAIGAGAIPVVIADGVTLPYENIIDWSTASIRLPNTYGQDAEALMNALPTDEATIMKMRKRVYDLNRQYFATPGARADAMLLDAAAMVKKGGKYSPIWNDYTQI